jgi:hypothetical protein
VFREFVSKRLTGTIAIDGEGYYFGVGRAGEASFKGALTSVSLIYEGHCTGTGCGSAVMQPPSPERERVPAEKKIARFLLKLDVPDHDRLR